MDSSLVAQELASVKKWMVVNVIVSSSVLIVLLLLLVAVKVGTTALLTEAKTQIEKFEKKAEQLENQARNQLRP